MSDLTENFQVDALDAEIISALLRNGRTKFVEIAKNTQTSANTIRTRFNKLKKNGIITGFTIIIDPIIFGNKCLGEICLETNHKEKANFVDDIIKNPGIQECAFQIGEFNYVAFFVLKNIQELDNLIEGINKNPYIKRTSINVRVDRFNVDYPQNLVIRPFEESWTANKNIGKIKTNFKKHDEFSNKDNFDKIDYEILKILFKNSRTSFNKIAKKLNISTQKVIRRYDRLTQQVIHHCSTTINLGKIGYFALAIFWIKLSTKHSNLSIFKKILKIPDAIFAYRVIGEFQVILGVPFKNMEQLTKTYIKITQTQGVLGVQFHLLKLPTSWPVNSFSKFIEKSVC